MIPILYCVCSAGPFGFDLYFKSNRAPKAPCSSVDILENLNLRPDLVSLPYKETMFGGNISEISYNKCLILISYSFDNKEGRPYILMEDTRIKLY